MTRLPVVKTRVETGSDQSACLGQMGHFFSGSFGSPDQAKNIWIALGL